MEYDKEFNELWENKLKFISRVSGPADETTCEISFAETHKLKAYEVWQAARRDHYRIGEEVESLDGTKKAKVCAVVECGGMYDLGDDNIRRIQAWKPKEGEAVLFENTFGYAECGRVEKCVSSFVTVKTSNGCVFCDDVKYLNPFSADKIGKKWEEL